MADHTLPVTRDTAINYFSRDTPPVLTVDPGDTVVVSSLDSGGHLEPMRAPGERPPIMFPDRRGHCLTGPIAVRGAEPGDTLAVRMTSLTPGSWGWTIAGAKDNALTRRLGVAGDVSWLLWDIDGDTATNNLGHTVHLAPFLGVTGVAPAEPGEHSTVPPRPSSGGNIDCRDLVAGSTLYLPVNVPGALLHLGDGHAAQGDGEVSGTAIECPMTTEVTLDLVAAEIPGVHAVTPSGRITFGFDEDLNAATADALDAMLVWMQSRYGLAKSPALALASSTVDLRVTQIANETWGVHAVLPHNAIR
ncbi:acetamidase/formamidase family protein [Actinocrispum wychmicini]|uniref:Acetamidase/formamidase n=1 Tax=Actinocrispum wychmicini TaxID=1213861 RepID=A0A4V2S677_9PSEU|nr:acetamidase/formamidase family protein [Actinocrispum wychmicini]TCO54960.1 acetamidase/formamidase [Actinocrispum wychmicini]